MISVYQFHQLENEVNDLRRRIEELERAKPQPSMPYPSVPYQPGPTVNGPLTVNCPACGPHSAFKACGNAACPLAPRVTF